MTAGNFLTVIVPWSSTANYPTGPGFEWDGLATKNAPGFTFFTPSPAFAPTAPQFNSMFNARDTWIANLNAWTGQLDGQNWSQFQTPTGIGATLQSIDWSPALGTWLGFAAVLSTNYTVWQTADGINWTQLGNALNASDFATGGTATGYAILTTPAGAVIAFSGLSFTQTYVPGSNTWAAAVAGPTGSVFTSNNNPKLVRNFAGGIVCAANIGASATGSCGISFSNNSAATWTNTSSSLPSNFGATTGGQSLIAAVGATTMLLFSHVANETHYLSSTDGQNWTTQTMPALNAGEQVVGATYDATNGIFYVVVTIPSTGPSRVFGSATGTSGWTLVSTHTNNPAPGTAVATGQNGNGMLAANGGELAMVVTVGQLLRVIVAQSQAALSTPLTWGFTRSVAPANSVRIQFAGSGFFGISGGTYAITHQAGPAPSLLSL
jgi:hypothetical protein